MNTRVASLLACLLLVPTVPLSAGEEDKDIRWLAVKNLRVDQVNPTLLMIDDEETRETREESRIAIAVRGIFPIKRQQELVAATTENMGDVIFLDYILERQALPEDASTKSEPKWERVNVKVAQNILKTAAGIDQVVADGSVISQVFTMPLPARGDGHWDKKVTHPKLKRQEGQLLFRYLDFDIEPGTYYRYRVRLKIANPLYDSQTTNPFLSAGETRATPWSRPSPSVFVTNAK